MFNSLYYVFDIRPHESGDLHHKLLGKFLLKDGTFLILEDHGMARVPLDTLSPAEISAKIQALASSQRTMVVSAEDLKQGHYPELLPSTQEGRRISSELKDAMDRQLSSDGGPTSVFDYFRDGSPAPQLLEIKGQTATLDGLALSQDELSRLMQNAQQGKAKIRHHIEGSNLQKIEPTLAEALGHIRRAVQQGHVAPEAVRTLNRQLFTDSMVPSLGNKMAYNDFLSRPRPGVHVHVDLQDFGQLNKHPYNYTVGDSAIVAAGKAFREAMDESVGRKNGKAFRVSGDEFRAHVPSSQHAAHFLRTFRQKLEAIPAIRGTFRLSTSAGYGTTPDNAESALVSAKHKKQLANHPKGQAPSYIEAHPEFTQPAAPTQVSN
jgi:GGDEF domain-containing protein